MSRVPSDFPDRSVCIFGQGYVGLTLAAVMADIGFDVLGTEIRDEVLACLQQGKAHFHEPGLDELVGKLVGRGLAFQLPHADRGAGLEPGGTDATRKRPHSKSTNSHVLAIRLAAVAVGDAGRARHPGRRRTAHLPLFRPGGLRQRAGAHRRRPCTAGGGLRPSIRSALQG